MAIEGAGRVINTVVVAAGAPISLKNCQGVTFYVYGTAEAFTLTSSATFGGTYATPGNIITRYRQSTTATGTQVWTEQTQAASNVITLGNAAYVYEFYVDANDLPAGNAYIKCAHAATGLVVAVTHDLSVQRDPANLVALSA